MNAPLRAEQTLVSLKSLAANMLKECDGDIPNTVASLMRRLKGDKILFASVLEEAVYSALDASSRHAFRADRQRILKVVDREIREEREADIHPPRPEPIGGVEAMTNAMRPVLMDFWVASGLRLANANKQQLQDKVAEYGKLISRTSRTARWLEMVLEELPDEESTVADHLSEKQVLELYKQAETQC